jgi:hypothetical protein
MDPDLRPQAPINQDFQPNEPQHNPALDLNKKQRKSRKKIWLFVSIPVILVLALVAAFWFYYSNPNRVLGDVVKKTYESDTVGYDGTVTVRGTEGEAFEITSKLNGEINDNSLSANTSNQISIGAINLNVDLGIIAKEDSAYLKINNATELANFIQTFVEDDSQIAAILPLFEELESTWISFDSESTEEMGVAGNCDPSKIDAWLENEKQVLYDLFKDHQFTTAKRGSDISLTEQQYSLTFDVQMAQEFFDHVLELESYKQLQQECDLDIEFDMSSMPELSADIWVNPWTHDVKRIAVKAVDPSYEMTLDLRVELNKQVDIQIPTDAKTLDEILGQYMQKQMDQQLESQLQ